MKIDASMIPDDVVEAAAAAMWGIYWPAIPWGEVRGLRLGQQFQDMALSSLAAALAAWPEVDVRFCCEATSHQALILPLPKEGE
jgi:hypothetical protein